MSDNALSLTQILSDEQAALDGRPLPSEHGESAPARLYSDLLADNRAALCLSGGGIRSAAFALGIVECLAGYSAPRFDGRQRRGDPSKTELLRQFDYLSTVSGGGYLGSWLSAWLYRTHDTSGAGHAGDIIKLLAQRTRETDEAEPIYNLRRNTDYLSPRFSVLSPDLWSGFAGIVRNLLLNWLVILPPLLLLILSTKALGWGLAAVLRPSVFALAVVDLLVIAAAVMMLVALSFAAANRPTRGIANMSQRAVLLCDVGCWLVGSALLVLCLASDLGWERAAVAIRLMPVDAHLQPVIAGAIAGVALYAVAWVAALAWRPSEQEVFTGDHGVRQRPWVDFFAWIGAGAVLGAAVGLGGELWIAVVKREAMWALQFAVLGIPWLLLARLLADVVFAGLSEGIGDSDANFEWLARADGIYSMAMLGWLIWFGLVLFGPGLVIEYWRVPLSLWLGTTTVSGAAAAALGKSTLTKASADLAAARRLIGWDGLALIAAIVFAAGLILGGAALLDSLAFNQVFVELPGLWSSPPVTPLVTWSHPQAMVAVIALLLLVVSIGASYFINVNRYSLHSLYRNRLARAFLGASRVDRGRALSVNRFTDFASDDSPLVHDLWKCRLPNGGDWQPLHLINTTLNLQSSLNPAWQERKALSFTISALHAGSGSTGLDAGGAFRRSYPFGGHKPYGGRYGLTLGTAMAISGAAVSPSMGYQSSGSVAILMTLFNVRLGWWLGNPCADFNNYWRTGPTFALWPTLMEMFGLTNEKRSWVYLSDGGHFENLGLYEMVRRRCRVIVVSDTGYDPNYTFADLGNALRKIWIDLGVRIDMTGLDLLKKRFTERPTPATDAPYWAAGRIRYPEAEGDPNREGRLLYLKAGLHGTEPMDVLSYALEHKDFPHEATANQFFTESQFESYRALGYVVAFKALAHAERERCAQLARTAPASSAVVVEEQTIVTRDGTVITDRETFVAEGAGPIASPAAASTDPSPPPDGSLSMTLTDIIAYLEADLSRQGAAAAPRGA